MVIDFAEALDVPRGRSLVIARCCTSRRPAGVSGPGVDFSFFGAVLLELLPGIPVTIGLTAASLLVGGLLALVMTWARLLAWPVDLLVRLFSFTLRGSPLLMQIFLLYYGLGQFAAVRDSLFWPVLRQPVWCAILALSLNTAAYTVEFLRGGLAAVPPGVVEAATVTGMSRFTTFRRIIMPLAIRQALPAYGSEIIIMVKSTSLASIITVSELTGIASGIASATFRPMQVFLCAGAVYLSINFLLSRGVARLEGHLDPLRRGTLP
ncbi:ABC transporter permease [Lichenifustis flavocetrariae]|uniref:ABC transporter permease subunit n=1 Tax=Lichenifustis flavocetrariae TaxID=2949735 RepID=A0AA41YTA7_9HYPH|nr:ABC transporter permease subunit [Lichenifustis flavocetrariae]MCW6506930.1 ABC transporter permease subunit [Lichenifustis flavocetrariae]